MEERTGIFAGPDPFEIARRWLAEAEDTDDTEDTSGKKEKDQ